MNLRACTIALLLATPVIQGAESRDPSDTQSARFIQIDGPATTLHWQEQVVIPVSEAAYQRLQAAMRQGPLHMRFYSEREVNSNRDPDPFHCLWFYYLARPAIELARRNGVPVIETKVDVGRSWFDEPKDMKVVAVVDEGRLPEIWTRINEGLAKSYFQAGITISVLANSKSGELVNLGPRGPIGPGPSSPEATVPPPVRIDVSIGYLVAYVPNSYVDVRDLDTKQVKRVSLGGRPVTMHDSDIRLQKRVRVHATATTPPEVGHGALL